MAVMPECDYPDDPPGLVHPIHHNVVAYNQLSQTWIDRLRKAPTETRVLCKGLNPLKKILNDPSSSGRVVLCDEVVELSDSVPSEIGPDDAVSRAYF